MPPNTQGRHGYFSIDADEGGAGAAVIYPVYNGNIEAPRNLQTAIPVGSSWAASVSEGLQSTRIISNCMLRQDAANEYFTTAFWNLFFNRPFSSGFDDTVPFTLEIGDGLVKSTMAGCKAEAFTIAAVPGAVPTLSTVFLAPTLPVVAAQTVPSAYTNQLNQNPMLNFDRVTVGGVTGKIYGVEVTFANNHLPDASLNGTKGMDGWDAGVFTAAITLTLPSSVADPFADGATITVVVNGGTGKVLTLTLDGAWANNPKSKVVHVGQIFRRWTCVVTGDATNKPLAYGIS